MSIFRLLDIKRNTTFDEVQKLYIRKLAVLHPDRNGGQEDNYLELVNEYSKYLSDLQNENPYLVCNKIKAKAGVYTCRCGGKYELSNEYLDKIECEYCSCFIELEEEIPTLPNIN